ncbi:hypothetical protein POVCU1_013970 [Plasmodium ovale curtisi]|uniref:Uncharacterized protein n=1 Tax=Plasmodium ovale curtisi TaxID=864141 RepID=A0A1A8W271_PLAOA|nr:hypothetical protein POVCU1_013970 [Plasmodium ovale curtisi]
MLSANVTEQLPLFRLAQTYNMQIRVRRDMSLIGKVVYWEKHKHHLGVLSKGERMQNHPKHVLTERSIRFTIVQPILLQVVLAVNAYHNTCVLNFSDGFSRTASELRHCTGKRGHAIAAI